jgi:hypothetical protein
VAIATLPQREEHLAATIVHLVHGTWPYGPVAHRLRWLRRPEATWFHEDSPFCLALKSALPDVTLRAFEWSGDNSYLERHTAAAGLARRLMECHDENDPPRQVLVAHSHGGNVALLAAMHPWSPPLAGIATLGAPFLHIKRRTQDERQQRLLAYLQRAAMLLTGSSAIVALCGQFGLLDVVSSGDTSLSGLWAFARGNLMFSVLLAILLWGMAGVAHKMDALRAAIDETPTWTFPRITPWIILRARGDEAAFVLAAVRLAYGALAFIWRPMRALLAFIAPALRHRWFTPLLLVLLAWMSSALQPLARMRFLGEPWRVAWHHFVPATGRPGSLIVQRVVHEIAGRIFDVGAPFAAAGFAALLVLGALLLVAGILLAPFGWELVTMGLAFEVNAETVPPGDAYKVVTVSYEWSGLRHSLHVSTEARTRLAEWIAQLPPAATGAGSRYWRIHGAPT